MTPLLDLTGHHRVRGIGRKAESIQWLLQHGFKVPPTHVLTFDEHARYVHDRSGYLESLTGRLSEKLDSAAAYAVRSSADVEDGSHHSFAGQFVTVLDVRGADALVDAVDSVFASTTSPTMAAYLKTVDPPVKDIRVAALIQNMVHPEASGVVFTKNPITGLDEMIIEAVPGVGTALMQDGETPDRWVDKWGGWKERPSQPRVDSGIVARVLAEARMVSEAYGRPVDLEWAFDGTDVYWLQARPISALDELSVYSDRISREVLPGLIKPLVWSVNVPLVNGAWIDLFTELIGANDFRPEDLAKAFHYRAYFNMGTIGRIMVALGLQRETLEVLMGLEGGSRTPSFKPSLATARHAHRMVRFTVDKLMYERRIEGLLSSSKAAYDSLLSQRTDDDDEAAVLERIDRLFALTREIAYANIVGPLLMRVYDGLLGRRLSKSGVDPDLVDVTAGMDELSEYAPDHHVRRLSERFSTLDPALQTQIASAGYEEFCSLPGIEDLQDAFHDVLQRFGHLSDSGNDFSHRPWREDPDLVLRMVVESAGNGTRSETRMQSWDELPLSRTERVRAAWLYRRARRFRLHRERISSRYTFGCGLFRLNFLLLGRSVAERGLLNEAEDIFYLYYDEVRAAVELGDAAVSQKDRVALRKQEMQSARDAVLPELIYGEQAPPLERPDRHAQRLRGVATSPGYYKGPARVVTSVSEFERVRPGDVLVIPYSDVSWTPLFANAAAVVAESGGILSHSSIVARERHLPAVVSVPRACSILRDGAIVSVDGYEGQVTVDE